MSRPQDAFQQEVQARICAKLGELTAQTIELGAMGDAMGARLGAMEERGRTLQGFADDLTAVLAVQALSGLL